MLTSDPHGGNGSPRRREAYSGNTPPPDATRPSLFRGRTAPSPRTRPSRKPRLARTDGDAILPAPAPAQPPQPASRQTRPASHTLGAPITEPTDPRWVLAIRTSDMLEGPILAPEKRDKLIREGKTMGLTAFDANLIIAIIQDQARRGYAPEYCPTAGEEQLAMVPLPRYTLRSARRPLLIALIIAALFTLELIALRILLG